MLRPHGVLRGPASCLLALGSLVLAACSGEAGDEPQAMPSPTGGAGAVATGGTSAGGMGAGATSAGGIGAGGTSAGGAGGTTAAGAPFLASESVARRLSQAELDRTLEDLLGDTSRPAAQRLPEDSFAPYDNDYTLQQASSALIDSLEALADDTAERVMADPALRARIVVCTPSGPDDSACFRQVVESFVRLAFRRPLASAEVDAYLTLLDFSVEAGSFDTAVALLIRSVLQDPEFLYRIEVGTPTAEPGVLALTPHELVTRLSYLLWGSQPGSALLDQADQGPLDAAARRELATGMLADLKARDQLHRFSSMWLGYRALPHPASLVAELSRETNALIDRVVFDEPHDFFELFTFGETYLTDALADHYGLSRPASGAGWVPYGGSGRAGILSHGSVLAAFSKFSDTSPTQRGIFVQTRLLCNTIDSPPANVDVDQPPGDDMAECKEARYAEHRSIPSCAGCHEQMDPIGFGLEQYDVGGVYRETDNGKPQCVLSGQGTLPGYGTFSGPAELGQMLVAEGLVQPCFVKQYLSFALGRAVEPEEAALLDDMGARFGASSNDLKTLILEYVASQPFAERKEPE